MRAGWREMRFPGAGQRICFPSALASLCLGEERDDGAGMGGCDARHTCLPRKTGLTLNPVRLSEICEASIPLFNCLRQFRCQPLRGMVSACDLT